MTAIVGMALGHRPIPNQPPAAAHTANFLLNASGSPSVSSFPSVKGNACEELPEGSVPCLNRLETDLGPHCISVKTKVTLPAWFIRRGPSNVHLACAENVTPSKPM